MQAGTVLKTIGIVSLIIVSIAAIFSSGFIKTSAAGRQVNIKMPSIAGQPWLNTSPVSDESLRGKVTLVEFWTFGCYNCVNVEPYVKKWHQKFHDKGLEVIAVHSPEFAHEKNIDNVRQYVKRKQITYPVAIDNDFTIWKRFNNRYWPALYLADKNGVIRYTHFGEGRYRETEKMIQELLNE